jgi:hypothetical protein
MRKMFNLNIIREIQMKTTMTYHFTAILWRISTMTIQKKTLLAGMWEKLKYVHETWE